MPAGRPSNLTPELQQTICDNIRKGLHIHRAAVAAGISETTFYRWMQWGAADPADEPKLDGLATKALRVIAKNAGHDIKPSTPRETLLQLLTDAGQGSWEPFRRFRAAVEEADAALEQRVIAQIQTAAGPLFDDNGRVTDRGKPETLQTFAARRWRHWSPTHQVELTGADGGPVEIEVSEERGLAERVQAYLKGVDDAQAVNENTE